MYNTNFSNRQLNKKLLISKQMLIFFGTEIKGNTRCTRSCAEHFLHTQQLGYTTVTLLFFHKPIKGLWCISALYQDVGCTSNYN